MKLLDRINRTGTTIVMATHDHAIVDAMQRRVVAIDKGVVVRDDRTGRYESAMRATTEMPIAPGLDAEAEYQELAAAVEEREARDEVAPPDEAVSVVDDVDVVVGDDDGIAEE